MTAKDFTVSFVIATFNNERTIGRCLHSIFSQRYQKEFIEVIIVDGGSNDKTLSIAKAFPVRILANPSRLDFGPKGGKAIGVREARYELIALIDADNELSSDSWLVSMTKPLAEDEEISMCIPARYIRREDPAINRYFSLYHEDPFLIPISPYHWLYGPSSNLSRHQKRISSGYVSVRIRKRCPIWIPNGAFIRRDALLAVGGFDADIDTALRMVEKGYNKFAYVYTAGIYHLFITNFSQYLMKSLRIVNRFYYFYSRNLRTQTFPIYLSDFEPSGFTRFLLRLLYCISIVGPLVEAAKGVRKDHDLAWLYNPVMCFVTVMSYVINPNTWKLLMRKRSLNRLTLPGA